MDTEYTVYLVCAVAGCALVALQVVLQIFGLFGDVDVDTGHADAHFGFDGDHAGMGGDHGFGAEGHGNLFFGILSFKAVTAFVGIFGLVGLIVLDSEMSFLARNGIAAGAGILGMFGVAQLMLLLVRLQASGTLDIRNAVGQRGTIYIRVPKAGEGRGKVTVTVQGRSMEIAAVSSGPELRTGAAVKVVSVEGDALRVAPVEEGN